MTAQGGWEETHQVDEDGDEDSAGDGLAVDRVVDAAEKLLVPAAVEAGDDSQDYDGEERDDGASDDRNEVSLKRNRKRPIANVDGDRSTLR